MKSFKFVNRCLLSYDYLKKNIFISGLPQEVSIESTNNCNLQCIMCPRIKMKRAKGFIEFRLFKKIIDEVRDYVEFIDLGMFGESLMHPKIFDMIEYCNLNNLKTMINTNMTYVDSEISKKIVNSGLSILVISMDGINKETYESIRSGANFENTLINIKRFLEIRKSNRPYTVIQMIYMNKNKDESISFLNFWKGKRIDAARIRPYENMDQDIIDLNALRPKKQNDFKPCIRLWRRMNVCWDGTVVPCCNDYDKIGALGNVESTSLKEIWNNEEYLELRRKHIVNQRSNISLCKSCFSFEAHPILVIGSTFLNSHVLRKCFYVLEKMLIFQKINLINYF